MCEGQISLLGKQKKQISIKNKIRLIELFAGIGSQAMALRDIGADFEHWRVCEFSKYSIASYNAIHHTQFETSDICDWTAQDLGIKDIDKYTYILTYSFPCQDLSNAGKKMGYDEGSGTRSSLLWEVKRLLQECGENLPQVLLMENVPAVHGKGNMDNFQKWLDFLESIGYSNYWKDLNAMDYGIPQSRKRCFCVSVLGDYTYEFPYRIPLTQCMMNRIEPVVDERYYKDNERARTLIMEYEESLKNLIHENIRGGADKRLI